MSFSATQFAGFRKFLGRQLFVRIANRTERRAIAKVMGDSDLQQLALSRITEEVGEFPDGLIQLLTFLLEHADEIIKIIVTIVDLFGVDE